MNILITGSRGFVAKNLICRLKTIKNVNLLLFSRTTSRKKFKEYLNIADFIFHLAGANRVNSKGSFKEDNIDLIKFITDYLISINKKTIIVFSSSVLVKRKDEYGKSKLNAENIIKFYSKKLYVKNYILRLTNIFGKWSKPNYNSVIATFCYKISRNLKINLNKNNKSINLLYIDYLIEYFLKIIKNTTYKKKIKQNFKTKKITVDNLEKKIRYFEECLKKNYLPIFQTDFDKNLYSTYLSFVPNRNIIKKLHINIDSRGKFAEIFKNELTGQISYFTINFARSRGGHFHISKNEKFLVLNGTAKFELVNINNNKKRTIILNDKEPNILNIPPGYKHKIHNIGSNTAILLVWANEIYDRNKHDTYLI